MPARFFAPAPIGSLLKTGAKPSRKPATERKGRERDPAHLDAIRQLPCLACGADIGCEAAHIRMGHKGGMGLRPDDPMAIPLCSACHRDQHATSEQKYWDARNIDPVKVANSLHRLSGQNEAMRQVVNLYRAAAVIGGRKEA
jgi:hypothetical protein